VIVAAAEEPRFAAQGYGLDRALRPAVVEREAPVVEEADERVALVVRVLERGADVAALLAERMEVPGAAKSVSVAIDRVAVPLEEIEIVGDFGKDRPTRVWHMAHAAALTLHDANGHALHTIRYACMPEGDLHEMDGALQADLMHVLSLRPKLDVVLLGDGASEVRRRLDGVVDGVADAAWDLVDFWHAVEKLSEAARAIAGGKDSDQRIRQWKGGCWRSTMPRCAFTPSWCRTPARKPSTRLRPPRELRGPLRSGWDPHPPDPSERSSSLPRSMSAQLGGWFPGRDLSRIAASMSRECTASKNSLAFTAFKLARARSRPSGAAGRDY